MEIGVVQRMMSSGLRFLRQTIRIRKSTNLHDTPYLPLRQSPSGLARFSTEFRSLFSKDYHVVNSTRVKCVWEAISFRLRKQGVQRLISSLNGRPVSNTRSYITLLSFGFVGFVISGDETTVHNTPNDFKDFESFLATVRRANNHEQNQYHGNEDEVCFPGHLDGYDVQNSSIGKGRFGAVYAARAGSNSTMIRSQLPKDNGISCQDDRSSGSEMQDGSSSATHSHENEDEWELVSQEKMATNSNTDVSLSSQDDISLDWSVVSLNGSGSQDQSQKDHPSINLLEESSPFMSDNGTYHFEGRFNLAIKIFVGSTSNDDIFEAERIVLYNEPCEDDNGRQLPPHPNIIKIHRAFTEGNISSERFKEARSLFPEALPAPQFQSGNGKLMFLVMKRHDVTLQDYMKEFGCQSEKTAQLMLCQGLEGVSHLVSKGIAHRDLKSDNILIRKVNNSEVPLLVITDFGCCLDGRETGLHVPLNPKTRLAGNTALRAPEISLSDYWASYLDYSKSDGWALGTIAFEICGMPNPFYARGASSIGYKEENLPRLPDFVSPEFEFVIMGLLKKDPNERMECKQAADMLHLLLWKPECWKKGHVNLRKISYLKPILYDWLYDVAYPERDFVGDRSTVVKQLQSTFLSRVDLEGLMKAGRKLIMIRWMAWLEEFSDTVIF